MNRTAPGGLKLLFLVLFFVFAAHAMQGCGASGGDTAPPRNVSVTRSGVCATSRTVLLSLAATDDTAVVAYYLSESPAAPAPGDAGWVDVEPAPTYSAEVSYLLSEGVGVKDVYAWFKDSSSRVSEAATAEVNLLFMDRGVEKPNIVWIVVDTLRADHTTVAGYGRDTTPNIATLAEGSVVFTNAIASAPWTTPSFTSMLMGIHAFRHEKNQYENTAPVATLVTKLNEAGYNTISLQTNHNVGGELDTDFAEAHLYLDDTDRNADENAVDKATQWLRNNTDAGESFFMFIGLISPHRPYKAQSAFLADFIMDEIYGSSESVSIAFELYGSMIIYYEDLASDAQSLLGPPSSGEDYYDDSRLYEAAYDAEIKTADYHIAKVLKTLENEGLYDDSIIIVTGDHGENMTDHGMYFTHGSNLFNSLIHVPLIMRFPGQAGGAVSSDYVRTIDILPTILDYLGLDPGEVDGESLTPVLNGQVTDLSSRPVISYSEDLTATGEARMASIIKDGYKLIKYDYGYELYDLTNDPGETSDLYESDQARADEMEAELSLYYAY